MKDKKMTVHKIVFILLAIAIAVLGSSPFIIWGKQIKELSSVGYFGLLIACFLTNATMFLPASGIAFTVSAATVLNPVICCLTGGIGTALGELTGYFCGLTGRRILHAQSTIFTKIQCGITNYGFYTVLLFAFLPFPVFDFVGVTAGVSKMSISKYLTACILGKTAKMCCYVLIAYRMLY